MRAICTQTMLNIEEADKLVLEHQGWAESIARSVARAWNMDWQLDGLDGAAMEALIFCSRRFDPSRGIPFRGYARKRIHEAASEAARKCKGWRRGSSSKAALDAREVSVELLNVFPELRTGQISFSDEGGTDNDGEMRSAIRQLLIGADIIASKLSMEFAQPDELLEIKRLIEMLGSLDTVHQALMWKIYWDGDSMRSVATDWQIDELNVIREHKVILAYLLKCMSVKRDLTKPRVRPGLKNIAIKMKKNLEDSYFTGLLKSFGRS